MTPHDVFSNTKVVEIKPVNRNATVFLGVLWIEVGNRILIIEGKSYLPGASKIRLSESERSSVISALKESVKYQILEEIERQFNLEDIRIVSNEGREHG